MNTNLQNKPSLLMAIALMTLVNGIFNIIWGLTIIIGTFGLSLLCAPLPLFPIILGGFEIAYAIKLLANPPQPIQPSQSIAILEIVAMLVGNVFSMVVGILVLIFYNDTAVKEYFARLNGMQPLPMTPSSGFTQEKPLPIPALPLDTAPSPSVPNLPIEAEHEPTVKPKPRPRKVA